MKIEDGGVLHYYLTTAESWTVWVKKAGAVVNITGKIIYFTVKKDLDVADAAAELQTTLAIVAGPAGEARLDLAPTDFAATPANRYYADLKLIMIAGTEPHVIWRGTIVLKQPVTRAIA